MQALHAISWLLFCGFCGCAPWPRLTLGASSTLQSSDDGRRRSVHLAASATLGWSALERLPQRSELDETPEVFASGARVCEESPLCRWETHQRDLTLARFGLPLEGESP